MIKYGFIATFISMVMMSAISIWAMNALPDTGLIPTHWNAMGEADGFASPQEARWLVWMLPAVTLLVSLIFAVGAKVDPRQKNIKKSGKAYLMSWIAVLVFMTAISSLVAYAMVNSVGVQQANSMSSSELELMRIMTSLVIGSISVLFMIIGNYLPKTRSNWVFGIRTPWTLSSEFTWEKTHRIGGRLFLLIGFLGLISAIFLPSTGQYTVLVGGVLGITLFSMIYSYMIWRTAPDRLSATDYAE